MALLEMGFNYKSLSKIAIYLQSEQNGMGFALEGNVGKIQLTRTVKSSDLKSI